MQLGRVEAAGRRTVASFRISSIGARGAVDAGSRDFEVTVTLAGEMFTGSIVVGAAPGRPQYLGSHLRTTLALMRWLIATAETEAPGARY